MNKFLLRTLAVLFVLSAAAAFAADRTNAPFHFTDVAKVVAISDIHGAYDAMVDILQQTGIIDESNNWTGGNTHLVVVGDLLDRGPDSRKAMDLVRALEEELRAASRAGRTCRVQSCRFCCATSVCRASTR